jgi:HK97 gp10 family phage protein
MDTFTPKVRAAPGLIPGKVSDELEFVMQVADDCASSHCPVRTGYLQSTIYHKVDGLSAELGATADYASYVELGTSRMSAEPFLRPAFEQMKGEVADALLRGLMAAFMGS